MRSVQAIQNLVYCAFESMIRNPETYSPCSVIEFEARLSSYLWVLAISDQREQDWSQMQDQLRAERNWSSPLNIVASVESDSGSAEDAKNIEGVIDFYAEFARRLGFCSDDQGA